MLAPRFKVGCAVKPVDPNPEKVVKGGNQLSTISKNFLKESWWLP